MAIKLKIKKDEPETGMGDIPKAAPLYIYREGTKYQCKDCYFYMDGKCSLFGKDVEIKPYGGCNFWMDGSKNTDKDWANTVTKEESGYMEEKDGFSCSQCEYFLKGKNACKKVDKNSPGDTPGKILPDACCNFWEKND